MQAPYIPQIRLYQDWLRAQRGLSFDSYDALWRWSTTDLDAFWQSVWDYFDIQSPTPHSAVLAKNTMPGAQWFPGAQVNFARQVLRHVDAAHAAGLPAIVSSNEKRQHREMAWPELRRQVASLALHLQAQGVQPGDRVAAYLPNVPETMVAFLATVSIGGVWSLCAPDMGTNAVLDRFRQIEPRVLIAVDGMTYGGRDHDRLGVLAELRAQLPTVRHTLLLGNLDPSASAPDCTPWARAVFQDDPEVEAFEPLWLPFDHPLWIVYSSGTTGMPKPIVHGHGGMVLVQMQLGALHNDIGGNRELPHEPGKMQCRMLGAAVEAWDEQGRPVLDAVGELVCTQPIPSMPLYLWGDDSGMRYLASYFDMYPAGHGRRPGGGDGPASMGAVWRHGDWIQIGADAGGGCVIFGRSDATINRHGLRMGTSELYSAVESLPEVLDSLVVDLEYLGRESYMPLFVVLRPGHALDDALRARIQGAIRTALSPRFVPDDIFAVAEVPRTLSGKKQELPIKKLLLGQPIEKVVNRDAMANPGCLDWYVDFAARRAQGAST